MTKMKRNLFSLLQLPSHLRRAKQLQRKTTVGLKKGWM